MSGTKGSNWQLEDRPAILRDFKQLGEQAVKDFMNKDECNVLYQTNSIQQHSCKPAGQEGQGGPQDDLSASSTSFW